MNPLVTSDKTGDSIDRAHRQVWTSTGLEDGALIEHGTTSPDGRPAAGGHLHATRGQLVLPTDRSRYEIGSIMVTSNLPFGRWGETFSDDVVAAAMIDRLVHHAEVLTSPGTPTAPRTRRELLTKAERGSFPL